MMKTSSMPLLRRFRQTILLLAIVLPALPAWARSYRISDFTGNIHVDKDGSARISEKISFAFNGEFHGVYRDIPTDYPGPKGSNYSLFIKVDRITDENGSALKYERHANKGYLHLKIYVPNAVDTTRTVNIEYSVPNATVFFPADTSGSLQVQSYRGVYGSSEPARSVVEGASASAETTNLPMRGGLTIDVYIPKGLLKEPGGLTKAGWFLRSNPVLAFPLWAFAVMFSLWWFKGRDPNPGMSVAPMYEPPEGMGPAEVGTLIDDGVNTRDITSVLVDLAVRGYVKIVETEHKGLILSSKDYELNLLKDRSAWGDLTDYERAMLDRIFAGGQTALISEMRNHFYTVLPMMKDEILSALKRKGMYTVDPESAHVYWVLGALLTIAPFVVLQWMGAADFLNSPALTIVCAL